MTKADSLDEPAFMSVKDSAAMTVSSSLYKLLLFIELDLTCVVDGAGLADNRDLDLAGVGHLILDLLCYL